MPMYRNLEEAISENKAELKEGQTLYFLLDDGIATVFEEERENGEKACLTFIDEIPLRVVGSVAQFRNA